MKGSRIKVLFFDVGGVLLNNGWGHQSRQEASERFGLNHEEMEVLHNFIFNVYEIGKITMDDYLDTVVFNHPRDFSKQDFKDFLFAQSVALPDFLPWLKEWKKSCGLRVISINNEGREINNYRIQKFGLHDCFDAFISSCEVGMRKPDPGIFNLAMGIAQVSPDECLYFDDRLMLAQAAQKLGIRSFHHQDFITTKQILEAHIHPSDTAV
ncbi:HAD-IA family hydrolase [Pedobacter gandavensis]|uniref:HAD family hydrolase n=1 Tax=Pedobacter gandavensis TaxID=2679963 RepID=UPI00292EBB64|nr:HAD-IA family hydrolase [Pedobacter gandavensis]